MINLNYKSCPLCRNIHIGSTELNNNNILLFNCSICYDDTNNDICKLKCGHYFHKSCIDKWFNYKKVDYNNIIVNQLDEELYEEYNNELYYIILFTLIYIIIFLFIKKIIYIIIFINIIIIKINNVFGFIIIN